MADLEAHTNEPRDLQCVVLAGGLGTRISEESHLRPKPMIEIAGKPILWHLMKSLGDQGVNEFLICLGYRGYMIKEFFANYFLHTADVTFDLGDNSMQIHQRTTEPWKVTLVDTGEHTLTGGRLRHVESYLKQRFMVTYGDGLADVNVRELLEFHSAHRRLATVTAVQPSGKFGVLTLSNDDVISFEEKPDGDGQGVSGGYFILDREALNYIPSDGPAWEGAPLRHLAADRQLAAFRHRGYWAAMDTLRDKMMLEEVAIAGKPPWRRYAEDAYAIVPDF